jgi:hypothetical protein
MSKGEITFIGAALSAIVLIVAMILGYNLYTNAQNRLAYQECLKTSERLADAERSNSGVRIVSLPFCRLP